MGRFSLEDVQNMVKLVEQYEVKPILFSRRDIPYKLEFIKSYIVKDRRPEVIAFYIGCLSGRPIEFIHPKMINSLRTEQWAKTKAINKFKKRLWKGKVKLAEPEAGRLDNNIT